MTGHLDENGHPCTRHAPPSEEGLLGLALLGSRMPSFHHDLASKLQSLMMAVDELDELAETSLELRQAADIANGAVRDLNTLIAANRALAKNPPRKPTPIVEVVTMASERSGVRVRGELATYHAEIALPVVSHALSVLLDLVAGPLALGRTIECSVAIEGSQLVLVFVGPPTAMDKLPPNANEVIAIAAYSLGREQGELRCGVDRFIIKLPLAA